MLRDSLVDSYFSKIKGYIKFLSNVINNAVQGKSDGFFVAGTHNGETGSDPNTIFGKKVFDNPSMFVEDLELLESMSFFLEMGETSNLESCNSETHYIECIADKSSFETQWLIMLSEQLSHKIFCSRLGDLQFDMNEFLISHLENTSKSISEERFKEDIKLLRVIGGCCSAFGQPFP